MPSRPDEGRAKETLDKMFRDGRVVKASLMRSTLHAVTVDDYRHFLPAIQPMRRSLNRRASSRPNASVENGQRKRTGAPSRPSAIATL